MKKFRLFYLILSLLILLPLTSCDLSLILEDSSRTNTGQKEINNEKENEKIEENKEDEPKEQEEAIVLDYNMNTYVKDYKDNYGYKALANDLEHGTFMQDAYKSFYESSLNILNSKEDIELDSSKTETETVNFVNIYHT